MSAWIRCFDKGGMLPESNNEGMPLRVLVSWTDIQGRKRVDVGWVSPGLANLGVASWYVDTQKHPITADAWMRMPDPFCGDGYRV